MPGALPLLLRPCDELGLNLLCGTLAGVHAAAPRQTANDPHSHVVYELNRDQLRWCVSPPGQVLPAEFSAEKGRNRSLATYRRVKAKKWRPPR
jgi:hypothetical protein